jgi:hypothetical protein
MHVRHELRPDDFPRRLRYSNWFNERCRNPNFLQSIIIGDEAGFVLNGEVNSHNVREYAPKGNPPAFNFERKNSRAKLTIWAALSGNGVILGGISTNAEASSLFRNLPFTLTINFGRDYFEVFGGHKMALQQIASLHEVRDRLNEVFGENRVIALQHNVEWPPRSPDLTPCDFFLWGSIKNKVFTTPPENIDVLRQRIIEEFNDLRQQPEMIRNVMRGMQRRTILFVERNGGHVEGHGP